jgi:type IV pilus assembly protein PilN
MIRINLLPVRAVKRRESSRQFLVLAIAVTLLGLVGNYVWYFIIDGSRNTLQAKLNDTNRRVAELEKVIGEVNNIKKRKAEVEAKLDALEALRKQRSGPVRLLDALSTCIPKKVSLGDFTETQNRVKITGQAESLEDLSEFMKGLANIVWTPKGMGRVVERKRDQPNSRVELLTGEGSMEEFANTEITNFFTEVELKSSETSAMPGKLNLRIVKFEIQMGAKYAI